MSHLQNFVLCQNEGTTLGSMAVALLKLMISCEPLSLSSPFLMVNVLNMLWARWLNMPLLMTRFPTIQCQLLGNSLKHLFNITWLKKSSMLTFLVFVMQAFGSCEIYNFMWSFSHCVLQARGKIMYVCL